MAVVIATRPANRIFTTDHLTWAISSIDARDDRLTGQVAEATLQANLGSFAVGI